jgi:hypothetical protein
MQTSIFSTYKTGENRVTSSIVAVLEYLSLQRSERLFGAILQLPDFKFIKFDNQVSKGGEGVPDCVIAGRFQIVVETKIRRNTVNLEQLRRHLKRLEGKLPSEYLLVLTPDDEQPSEIEKLGDDRVVWSSFASLDQAIGELLDDKKETISEREAFLLRHLQLMLEQENLLRSAYDVVVIPARFAWSEYNRIKAYVCQPDRFIQPVKYVAFYSSGQIRELVPKIIEMSKTVQFLRNAYPGRLGEIVNMFLDTKRVEEGERLQVFILSGPDDPETEHLSNPIQNDSQSQSGRVTAYTQNQRYVTLARLKKAKKTSDLGGSD